MHPQVSLEPVQYLILNLANSSVTIGSTAVALGATVSTIAGLTSLTSGTLI